MREEERRRREERREQETIEEESRVRREERRAAAEALSADLERGRAVPIELFDLTSLHVEGRTGGQEEEVDRSQELEELEELEELPPSYSLAEGLDQLPSYEEAQARSKHYSKHQMVTETTLLLALRH